MSRVTVTPLTASARPGEDLGRVGARMVSLTTETFTQFIEQMARLLGPAMAARPQVDLGRLFPALKRDACCEIPEVDCPPRCVCEMVWETARGEQLRGTVRIRNTSGVPRTFTVSATEFAGPSAPASMTVSPGTLNLAGGASGLVEVSFVVPESFSEGSYEAEIVIVGSYEQCVRVRLKVLPKHRCPQGEPHAHCEVAQGDPPVRIRAHHWYDHFQCAEPCESARPVVPQ